MARNKNKNNLGFTQALAFRKSGAGFTLIELLVVVAIIGLLSSIVLIAVLQARQKSRDAKRIGDMTGMNNALELYYATYKGYPSETNGIPKVGTDVVSTIPSAPTPPDGVCAGLTHSNTCSGQDSNCTNVPANTYYYVASGSPQTFNGNTVYPDYAYFFCLGAQTGNFAAGERILTPTGVH